MEKIPVAVVGLGRIASLLEDDPLREKPCTHAGAVAADADCVLAGGADADENRLYLFAKRWQCPVYADAETMLKERAPRILIIATHPDSHAEYCALAAENGVQAVICEKPLADSLESAKRIAALPITVLTNHERRYSANYIRAKAVLSGRGLGKLLSVKATLYMGANRRLLDVLWHDGTHLADALMFLSGSRLRHRQKWGSRLTSREGTAYLMGCLEPDETAFDSNEKKAEKKEKIFCIELGGKRDHLVFEMEFSCEQGRLRIGNGVFEIWESGASPYAEGFRSLQKTPEVFEGPTGYFANMLQDAVACVRDPARKPCSGADDGLRVIEYLNSVHPW
ncbi:MAG: Gfo/Idh/MocA family oxidoreductase [Spirochaetaceae bacterium]|jgi:predicted dehydrogenase|nr:Gfo/Idh/MocA family oxidoreductase [Spirochaetaceae bacterium]